MPYTLDNPPDRIKGLPKHAQEIWIKAYNNALKEYDGDEEKANATAWSAVKKAGYKKNKDGNWEKMQEKFKCECIECGHKMTSDKHCADLKCPKCGGAMRREERPGPGRYGEEPNFDEVEIFKVGSYPQGSFRQKDLDEIVENYNSQRQHEAPVTVDHAFSGPSHGWVEKIWRKGNKLYAKLREISDWLKEQIVSGAYKKRSIEIYQDWEGTGKLMLKAVSFLGAMIPQVKGLKNVYGEYTDVHGLVSSFHEDEGIGLFAATEEQKESQKARAAKYGISILDDGNVTKPGRWSNVSDDEWADPVNYAYPCPNKEQTQAALKYWGMPRNKGRYSSKDQSKITERLRKFAKKFEIESEILKHSEEDMTEQEVQKLLDKQKVELEERFTSFKEENDDKIKKLEEENKELKEKQVTHFSEAALKEREVRVNNVVDQLLKDNKITPAHIDAGFTKFLMAQPPDTKFEIGEGDGKKEVSLIDFAIDLFSNKVKGAPVVFEELTKKDEKTGLPSGALQFSVMESNNAKNAVSKDSLDLSVKAEAYAKENKVSFKEGLIAVSRSQ